MFDDPTIQPRIDQIQAHGQELVTRMMGLFASGEIDAARALATELGELTGYLASRALVFERTATDLADGDERILAAIAELVRAAPLPGD